jgi:allophanate hydrolase subunit 2
MIEVVKAQGLVTLQDLGHPGHMHEGIPPGGALAPARLVAANRAAGNREDALAIEVLGRLAVRATAAIETSLGTLAAGEELVVESEPRRVAYLALRGGVQGRAALVCAGLGTFVTAGMTLAIAGEPHRVWAPVTLDESDRPIRVIPGPDAFPQVIGSYRISPASDRIGTRLHGPPIAAEQGTSRPMVRGAIEVPPDGQPIVLGPEHPTTGGYPLIGVIASADLDRFFSIRLGGSVRFQYV